MKHPNEIDPSPHAHTAVDAKECLRVWKMKEGIKMSIVPHNLHEEPGGWGILLVDIINHVSEAYHQMHGLDPDESRAQILQMFLAELKSPTA